MSLHLKRERRVEADLVAHECLSHAGSKMGSCVKHWREQWFNRHIEPPSWVIGDEVIAAGVKGVLFPSAIKLGGFNLVIYTASLTVTDQLSVYDPGQALPQDQSSWK